MKKTLYFIFAICTLAIVSCTNDFEQEINDGKFSFSSISASMGDLPTTRTHLENGGRVVWDINDQIGIISDTQEEPTLFTCTSVDDGKALFNSDKEVSGKSFLAYYPYDGSEIEGNSMAYTLSSNTQYVADTYFRQTPMIAKSNTNEFKFKHTCGIIKFSITGTQKISSLVLQGNDNEIIAGTGSIDLNEETPILSIPANAKDASETITMSTNNLQLSATSTDLYFIVPETKFTQGLTLTINYLNADSSITPIKKTTAKSIHISRSVMKCFNIMDTNAIIQEEEEERIYSALMTFYNATGGENWTNNTNWGSEKPLYEWYGLLTEGKDVLSINLTNNNLKGHIPKEISEFNKLIQLALSNNKLCDSIPKAIGLLYDLEILLLSDNNIEGKVPESICNLTKLWQLRLENNRLTGELPKDMGNMTALEIFDIGTYSASAGGGSVDFNDTSLYYNQISGEIPQSITKLTNLKQFGAVENKLSGNIPDEIWSMPSLTALYLTGNMLTGSISPTIANAKNLEQLWLQNNHLTGQIPEDICELTNLKELLIGNAYMSMATGVYSIYQYNKFEGGIPNNINKLTNLVQLDMSTCGLSGEIPNSLYTMSNLYSFDLSNGGGDWFEDLEGILGIDSTLSAQIRENYNHISGNISSAVAGMTGLARFGVSGNEITGTIPKEFGNLASLQSLSLDKNKITGTIPAELGNLQNLLSLSLNENEIEGSIPAEIGNLTRLELLYLMSNKISGTLPIELSELQNLLFAHLGYNNIEGNIPKEYANLTNLNVLDLAHNRMSGDIPEEITSSPMWSTSRWNPALWILPQQEGYGFNGYTIGDEYYNSSDYSADGKVKTLHTASVGNGINIVLMGDGYSDRLITDGTYDEVMNTAMEKFFSEEPYKSYRNMFNVYSVTAVSKNEVYANGSQTAFSGFFGNGTHVGGNDQKVFEYALKAINEEQMDEALIVVMMNSINYAGTCYMYHPEDTNNYGNGASISYFPVGIDDTALAEVLHHEAGGHGFAKLADEYAYAEYGTVPTDYVTEIQTQQSSWGWWKNVDFTNDLNTIRWGYFIDDTRYTNDGLGAYEGGLTYWRGVWRPTENSIMRYNTGGFNAPSREAIYYRIHKLAYGDSWEYDYEDFVEYDAKNRQSSSTRTSNYVERPKDYKPLHVPITIKGSWKNAKNNSPKKKFSNNSNLYKAPAKVSKPKAMPTITKANYYRTPDGKLQYEIKTEHLKE